MKRINLIFLSLISSLWIIVPATAQSFSWAGTMGGSERETATGICIDPVGNMYTTGYFQIRGDFNPGAGTHLLPVSTEPNANWDIYVVKTNNSGEFLWAGKIGGRQLTRSVAITTDDSGNVYVAGFFASGRIDCDPGPDTFWLSTVGSSNNSFLCKLDSSGKFVWARAFGSSNVMAKDMVVDRAGNVYLGGYFSTRTDFNPGPDSFFLEDPIGTSGYVCKLRHDGEFLWAIDVGGMVTALGVDLLGQLSVGGTFTGKRDLDPSSDSTIVQATAGNQDVFLSQFDSSGDFNWGRSFGGNYLDDLTGLSVDGNNSIFICGIYSGLVDFDPGPGYDTFSTLSVNTYLSKFNASGAYQWSKNLKGIDYVWAAGVTCNQENSVFVAGYFHKTADFDPGSGTHFLTVTGGASSVHPDAFVCKLDSNGDFKWAFHVGSTSTEEAGAIAVDKSSNVFTTGTYVATVDFDPGPEKFELTSQGPGFGDIYIQKVRDCVSSYHSFAASGCKTYRAPDGKVYSASGTVKAILPNAVGCDSIITIALTITAVDVIVNANGSTLTADYTGADSYVWIYCDSNNKPVPGAVSQTWVVNKTGNYAVIVGKNSCTDTSDCVYVDLTSVQPALSYDQIEYFPNPSQGKVNIHLPENWNGSFIVEVFDIAGKKIQESMQLYTRQFDLTLQVPGGLYWIRIISPTEQTIFPVLIHP